MAQVTWEKRAALCIDAVGGTGAVLEGFRRVGLIGGGGGPAVGGVRRFKREHVLQWGSR